MLTAHTWIVSFAMIVERSFHRELATTEFTVEWFFTGVNTDVSYQITWLLEAFTTRRTSVEVLGTAASLGSL